MNIKLLLSCSLAICLSLTAVSCNKEDGSSLSGSSAIEVLAPYEPQFQDI